MTLEAFIAARQERWAELEHLVARSRRGRMRTMSVADVEHFGAIYRHTASDLAMVRRDHPGSEAARYLNDLCARAHPLLYRAAPLRGRDIWRWFALDIPRSFRAHRAYVMASVALLLAGVVAGWLAVALRPDLRSSLVPASGFDELARGQLGALPAAPLLGTIIVTNNIRVAAVCFLGGALLGIPTTLMLAANGWMLGTLAAAVHQGGYDLAFWSLIVPHGVLELSIIVIAGAAGLAVGDSLLRPGLRRRGESFTRAAGAAFGLFAGTALLLVIAGVLEAFVSPGPLPAPAKLAVGGCVGIALYLWLLGAGRTGRSSPGAGADPAGA